MAEIETAPVIVSKAQFAAMRNVTPGRVSQWIADGRIERNALIGEGRNSKINVPLASIQLSRGRAAAVPDADEIAACHAEVTAATTSLVTAAETAIAVFDGALARLREAVVALKERRERPLLSQRENGERHGR
jgi:hypothetical protein